MRRIFLFSIIAFSINICAQVPNPGFEQWTDLLPDDWITNSCPVCDPPWESYIVRQDSDSYSGNYNADLYANGVFKPFAYTQFPVLNHPQKMRFHMKASFAPCVNDSGYFEQDTVTAKVELLYNSAVVDSGQWSYTGLSVSSYQMVEVLLSRNATVFDSCRIYFEGGKVFGGCGVIAAATQFKVDDVELVFGCEAQMYYSKQIDTVNFSGISNQDSITNALWDFGDGQTDTLLNPQHIFTNDAWYHVCFTATGIDSTANSCTATACDSIYITHGCIDSSQICAPGSLCCDAPFFEPVCGCNNVTYGNACIAMLWGGVTSYTPGECQPDTFICTATIAITRHNDTVDFSATYNLSMPLSALWDFGDGQADTNITPQHIYAHPGWYYPCFTISGQDSSGSNCTATACDSVYITDGCIDSSLICIDTAQCCHAPPINPVCGCDSITYDNGCKAMLRHGIIHYTAGPCLTSIKEITTVKLSLSPNPARETTVLRAELPAPGTVTVKVKNIIGQTLIASLSLVTRDAHYAQAIRLEGIPRGLYFVEIILNGEIVAVTKLVKD